MPAFVCGAERARQDEQQNVGKWSARSLFEHSQAAKDRRWSKQLNLTVPSRTLRQVLYHRRPRLCCILAPGDTEGEGLDMVMPVNGLTMGMALRGRLAAGWWILREDECWL
jgi:hypothetical protein